MTKYIAICLFIVGLSSLVGCGDQSQSFSLMADSNSFQQAAVKTNTKIDILWVIDNSGSMETSQQQLADNFSSFINGFSKRNFDFRMAVTTTDAYLGLDEFTGFHDYAKFRDGTDYTSHSGTFVIDPNTANLSSVFMTNIMQGIYGSGDERAFQSFQAALDSSENGGVNDGFDFPRKDAFLAVIIVSDEDDFSHDSYDFIEDYNNPAIIPVQSYVDFLDHLTNSSSSDRRYSVSAMAVFDDACKTKLEGFFSGRKIAKRYGEIVDLTGGTKGSLCDDFASTLESISGNILTLATQFRLTRIPKPETLTVTVSGKSIPACYIDSATGGTTPLASSTTTANPAGCGFTYDSTQNSVVFHGEFVPPQGSAINVNFDPVAYGQ